MIGIVIALMVGTFFGMLIMGILAAGAYARGWRDAEIDHGWRTPQP